jgi:ParB-like chromosome segregation protein Spo0J
MALSAQSRELERQVYARAISMGHNLARFRDLATANQTFRQAYCRNCGAEVVYTSANPGGLTATPLIQHCTDTPRTTKGGHAV